MTEDEIFELAKILSTADGDCYYCAEALAERMEAKFPGPPWKTLVEEAGRIRPDEAKMRALLQI